MSKIDTLFKIFNRFDEVFPGVRGYNCNSNTVRKCKARCCYIDPFGMSPLDISIISFYNKIPPSEFIIFNKYPDFFLSYNDDKIRKLFLLKAEKKRCIFNKEDYSCEIYQSRPLLCRLFPYDLDVSNKKVLQISCPAAFKGKKLSKKDIEDVKKQLKVAYTMESISYCITRKELEKINKHPEKSRDILENRFEINWELPVKSLNLMENIKKLKKWTTLEGDLEWIGINVDDVVGIYKKLYFKSNHRFKT